MAEVGGGGSLAARKRASISEDGRRGCPRRIWRRPRRRHACRRGGNPTVYRGHRNMRTKPRNDDDGDEAARI